jgi:hypothetical protein
MPFAAMVAACVRLGSTLIGVGRGYAGDILGSEQWEWLEATEVTGARLADASLRWHDVVFIVGGQRLRYSLPLHTCPAYAQVCCSAFV